MTKEEFEEMTRFKLLGEAEGLVNEFISYWVETSLNGKKMRFEGEKYFDINRRFGTWKKNSKKFPNSETINPIEATLTAYNEALKNMGL